MIHVHKFRFWEAFGAFKAKQSRQAIRGVRFEQARAEKTPSIPLSRCVKRAAGWKPVCICALSTTMAPGHSPQ